ncbi:MAG: DHHA1 domain-containing protein [Thermoprotei archaeon]|nr:DHHA1 domain-containing protein [TACK group archaeon]
MSFDYVIAHGDEDGVCSAALLERASPGARVLIASPGELARTLLNLPQGSRVAVVDVALPVNYSPVIKAAERMSFLHYIDHHPLPRGLRGNEKDLPFSLIDRDLEACASELVHKRFGDQSSAPLAVYGAIGDYMDQTAYVQALLEKQDRRTVYFEAAMIGYAISERHNSSFSARLAHELATYVRPGYIRGLELLADAGLKHEYMVMDYVKSHARPLFGKLAVVEGTPLSGYAGKTAFYAMSYLGLQAGACVNPRDQQVDVVLRGNGSVDLGELAATLAEELGGEGGGHERAASFSVPDTKLDAAISAICSRLRPLLSRAKLNRKGAFPDLHLIDPKYI